MHTETDIYLFNPTSEMAVANETVSWQPNTLLKKLEADLAVLPMCFAGANDVVIVPQQPGQKFMEQFNELNIDIPSFSTLDVLTDMMNDNLVNPGAICPWGWSQVVHHKLKTIIPHCNSDFKGGPMREWNPELKAYISREFALKVLLKLLNNFGRDYLEGKDIPVKCHSLEEIESAHTRNNLSIIKMPWSSSGRGLQVIDRDSIHPSIKDRLRGAIKQQGFVMTDPLLDNKLDFATHFRIKKGKIDYLGYSLFGTSADGKYSGNYLKKSVTEEQKPYVEFLESKVAEISDSLLKVLEELNLPAVYEGFFGVDGFVFLQDNKLKLHPCLEINLRYNMGLLSFELEKLLAEQSKGMFHQFGGKAGEFKMLMEQKQKENPLVCRGGEIVKGIISLTEVLETSSFGAYLEAFE